MEVRAQLPRVWPGPRGHLGWCHLCKIPTLIPLATFLLLPLYIQSAGRLLAVSFKS